MIYIASFKSAKATCRDDALKINETKQTGKSGLDVRDEVVGQNTRGAFSGKIIFSMIVSTALMRP